MPNRRTVMLAGLLIAVALLLAYALIIFPRQGGQGRRLRQDLQRMETQQREAQVELERIRSAAQALLKTGVPLQSPSKQPWNDRVNGIIQRIDEWVQRTGVRLLTLEPGDSEEGIPLIRHSFLLEFEGTFSQICRFMQGLEGDLRLVPLEWSMVKDPKGSGAVRADCKAVAFEWKAEALDLPAAPARVDKFLEMVSLQDPFTRLPAATAQPRVPEAPSEASGPKLTGILDFGGRRRAVIDGKVYAVGDRVEGEKRIIDITEDTVVLEGEPRPLKIRRPLRAVVPPRPDEPKATGKE